MVSSGKSPLLDSGKSSLLPAWLVLFVLCGVAFTSNVIISIIAPFLPQHFEAIGVSQMWCAVMFSGFPLASLISSPAAADAMGRVGRVPVLTFGLLLQGVSTVTFGYADDLSGGIGVNTSAALAIYALSRLACGFGGACSNNAIFSIAADRFPDTLGKVMGLNEVVIGLGFSLGPPIGTALRMSGGFSLPFTVSGAMVFIFSFFALLLWQKPQVQIEDEAEEVASEEDRGGFREVLTPGLIVAGLAVLLGTGVFGIVEPILSLYLQDHVGMRQAGTAGVFAAFAFSYSLAGPAMGALADRFGPMPVCTGGIMASGFIMALFLGPVASNFHKGSVTRITYEVSVLVALGLSQAAALIPSLPAMKSAVLRQSPSITERIVSCFNMFLQSGLVIGPPVGTYFSETVGFETGVLITGAAMAAYGAFALNFAVRTMHISGYNPSQTLATPPIGRQTSLGSPAMRQQSSLGAPMNNLVSPSSSDLQ